MTLLSDSARAVAGLLGRDSWIVRHLRPAYETVVEWSAGGRGIPWRINGVTYRIDPRYRHQMGNAYDPTIAAWLADRVRPGQVALDVGANVGVYVLQFAHWTRPGGRVIAVEPNPTARVVLEKHVRLNQLESRVEIVPTAVGATAGDAPFYAAGTDGMSRLGAPNPAIADRTTRITTPVVTLDQLCEARRPEPDWPLLDIEGFELAALSGARRLLTGAAKRPGVV